VDDGLAREVAAARKELSGTNELKGLVLDLRFAVGRDYAEAGGVADLFLSNEQPLLDWGVAAVRSKAKTNALKLPVAVLVNRQTRAAAEALAAVLRETGAGLVLGTNTAGRAMIAQEFSLKNGQRLRIATAGIKLGSGEVLSVRGVKPDIEVALSAEEEQAYLANPFKEWPGTNLLASATAASTNNVANGTNRPSRRRVTEADLVRERREGVSLEPDWPGASAKATESEEPVVRDPVLARALDLLKGLAVVRQFRSP
jgi:C-terminal processing protease CtpA/Prc